MIRRKRSVFLFLGTAAVMSGILLTAACTKEEEPIIAEVALTPASVSVTANAEERAETAAPDKTAEPKPIMKQEETDYPKTTEDLRSSETAVPSATPFYEPEIEEDPSVRYLETPDPVNADAKSHKSIPLWHSKEYLPYGANSSMPSIVPYLAEGEGLKTSVIIFPGGGYEMISMGREGTEAAEYISEKLNMNAFVVKYRVAPNNYRAILSDALRAVRFVRYYAEQLHTDWNRIVVLGFSAGGHLAMMTAEHFDYGKTGDDIDAESSRPDAVFLCYPVGSMVSTYTHKGSRTAFLGKEDTEENRIRFSAEKGLRVDMPPVFIIHSEDDRIVPIENSIETVKAMEETGLDISYRWYAEGGHGYGIAGIKWYGIDWPAMMEEWLKDHGF